MLAIESVDMDAIISDLNCEIIDVELTTLRPVICRESERVGGQELEVRLHLKRGDIIVIHSYFGYTIT